MDFNRLLHTFSDAMGTRLFTIGGSKIDVMTLLTAMVILFVSIRASRTIARTATQTFLFKEIKSEGGQFVAQRLVRYAVLLTGVAMAIGVLGIDLGALFTAGAVFAVGAGLALQHLAQDIVAGFILIFERDIKPGDVLEVDGRLVRVLELGLRATVARSLDEEDLIIPNGQLMKGIVKNFTLRDSLYRVRAQVGVHYGSNLNEVEEVLYQAARSFERRVQDHEPRILLVRFGSSSVDFDISIWTHDPWSQPRTLSELNHQVWDALKKAGVTIAYPQVDLHIDASVQHAMEGMRRQLPSAD